MSHIIFANEEHVAVDKSDYQGSSLSIILHMFKKDFVVASEEQHTERGWTRFSVQSTPSQLGSNPDWSYETCQSYN